MPWANEFVVRETYPEWLSGYALLCEADPSRISLLVFAPPPGGAVQHVVTVRNPSVSEADLNNFIPPLILNYRDHGGLVQAAWYFKTALVGQKFQVIETLYRRSR